MEEARERRRQGRERRATRELSRREISLERVSTSATHASRWCAPYGSLCAADPGGDRLVVAAWLRRGDYALASSERGSSVASWCSFPGDPSRVVAGKRASARPVSEGGCLCRPWAREEEGPKDTVLQPCYPSSTLERYPDGGTQGDIAILPKAHASTCPQTRLFRRRWNTPLQPESFSAVSGPAEVRQPQGLSVSSSPA